MVSPPACGLIATGHKKVENCTIKDWVAWGSQGHLVVAFYQGASVLENINKYIPAPLCGSPTNVEHKGSIVALGILGPATSPSHPSDEGWFHEVTPGGANSSMHRIVALWRPVTPYTPRPHYRLAGG